MIKSKQITPSYIALSQELLDSFNVEQARVENKARLIEIGGLDLLCKAIGVSIDRGLTAAQVETMRKQFGDNTFPESPMSNFSSLLFDAFSDRTLIVLLIAAGVSLGIGVVDDPQYGWIEGTAIFIAVFLVANISAANDYTKELQFRALEQSAQIDERASVLRDGVIERINPVEIVVGDILVVQVGDAIMADGILVSNGTIECNESSLTGESRTVKKSKNGDCFVLSSCLVTGGDEGRMLVTGIGSHSQWGRIKIGLVSESVNTPLQDKLENMSTQIGYIGIFAAFGTLIALIIDIWARQGGQNISVNIVKAFILAVTIVVVAIPEGLPLAVTIALAYSTKKMYRDQCFIRVLAACETMGNCTNICSDKTGTLTQNKMTCVEGWFGDVRLDQSRFNKAAIPSRVKRLFIEHACVNRTAYLVYHDHSKVNISSVIGNKTEGVLIDLVQSWGFDYDSVKNGLFNEATDRVFPFNSWKKRSTAIIHRYDGSVRMFCKGAPELLLVDCTRYMNQAGEEVEMTAEKRTELESAISDMANNALRTLLVAHRDFKSKSELPADWEESPPDNGNLCCDCIVGVIDPLRPDVKDAIAFAHQAGVFVRMVTGDSTKTAKTIARQCGILTEDGLIVEGPVFRSMTPAQVDEILPRLQVMARSSPDDKHLLVSRLNGKGIPKDRAEWESKHYHLNWDTDRDLKLPGYLEEWEQSRPEGGEVVGVTGDGTNDAPALHEADVGLAMGITGTKVAQSASDIIILDDRFSSIVRSIIWGRSVYDNIRKFLQFQLTVNIVSLILVFVGAVAGYGQPLTAVQMLWVNLIMDTFGALALGTEAPTNHLLNRKPYKRNASLISRPMWRNILCQAAYQLTMLFVLLFMGVKLFNVRESTFCVSYHVKSDKGAHWNVYPSLATAGGVVMEAANNSSGPWYAVTCSTFTEYCLDDKDSDCFESFHHFHNNQSLPTFRFPDLHKFEDTCLSCTEYDMTHSTIIFNAFIFCQFFNEYSSRILNDDLNMFHDLWGNYTFVFVSVMTFAIQVLLVSVGGRFVQTTPLTIYQWLITVALGSITIPVGVLMRLIPIREDVKSFYHNQFLDSQLHGVNGSSKLSSSGVESNRVMKGVKDYLSAGSGGSNSNADGELEMAVSNAGSSRKTNRSTSNNIINSNNNNTNNSSVHTNSSAKAALTFGHMVTKPFRGLGGSIIIGGQDNTMNASSASMDGHSSLFSIPSPEKASARKINPSG